MDTQLDAQTLNDKRTKCEIWTRVMGYHRPVSFFNIGKKAEHYSRKHFTACASANSAFLKKYSNLLTNNATLVTSTTSA